MLLLSLHLLLHCLFAWQPHWVYQSNLPVPAALQESLQALPLWNRNFRNELDIQCQIEIKSSHSCFPDLSFTGDKFIQFFCSWSLGANCFIMRLVHCLTLDSWKFLTICFVKLSFQVYFVKPGMKKQQREGKMLSFFIKITNMFMA